MLFCKLIKNFVIGCVCDEKYIIFGFILQVVFYGIKGYYNVYWDLVCVELKVFCCIRECIK